MPLSHWMRDGIIHGGEDNWWQKASELNGAPLIVIFLKNLESCVYEHRAVRILYEIIFHKDQRAVVHKILSVMLEYHKRRFSTQVHFYCALKQVCDPLHSRLF